MNRIFISHSSKDAQQAEMVLGWLKQAGIEAFLDSDKEHGLKAGSDWDEQLKLRLEECSVLIPICSHHFRESDWCHYEVSVAYHKGMDIIPIVIDDSSGLSILKRFQAINYYNKPEEARERLLTGLKPILEALQPVDWDSKRRPFPGLDPFVEADEAIFFGRQREINDGVQTLRSLRRERDIALLMVIGASGSGKSSLVRAGILPRMKRDPEQWIVLDTFRPGQEPFHVFVNNLVSLFQANGEKRDRSEMLRLFQASPIETLSDLLADLRNLTRRNEAVLLISIDQFEELLEVSKNADEPSGSKQQETFLTFLKQILDGKNSRGRWLILATIRSDYLDAFQSLFKGLKYKDFLLRPMEEENFHQVIEEPARIAGFKIESQLVNQMIADTKTGDALPLLAFTLRELWEKKIKESKPSLPRPQLTESDYWQIGGLEGAIQKTAEDIFISHCPKGQEERCRDAFLRMIRSNADVDQVGWVKKAAPWSDMPSESLETLDRFVTARLLVKKTVEDHVWIEPSHEALLRNWDRLRLWIKEENDFLLWRDRFDSDFVQWRKSQLPIKDYLIGAKLGEAERWKTKFSESSQERVFIEKSIQRRKTFRQLRIALFTLLTAALLASLYSWQMAEEAKAEQLKIRQRSSLDRDPFESGITGLAAMGRFFLRPGVNYQIVRGLEQALAKNLARTEKLSTSLSRIDAISTVSDDRLIIAGIQGSSAYLLNVEMDPNGGLTLRSPPQKTNQTTILKLLPQKDQKKFYSLGFSDEHILLTTWPTGEEKQIFQSQRIDPQTLAFIPGPQLIIAAYGEGDGRLYLWSNGDVVQTLTGVPRTTAFVALENGQLISAHDNGPLRIWTIMSVNGKPQVKEVGQYNNNGTILSLTAFTRDGSTILIAGGDDGSLRVWKDGKEGPKVDGKASGQGQIISLLSLPSGDVISGDDQSTIRWWKWNGHQTGLQPSMPKPFNTEQLAIKGLIPFPQSKDSISSVISSGADGSLRLLAYQPYPLADPLQTSTPSVRSDVTDLTDLGDGLLASAHHDGRVCWWDLPSRLPEHIRPDCKRLPINVTPSALLYTPRDALLVAGGSDGILYTLNRNRQLNASDSQDSASQRSPITSLMSVGGATFLSGHADGWLRWHDLQGTSTRGQTVDAGHPPVEKLQSLGGSLFVSADGPPGAEWLRWWRGSRPLSAQGVPIPHDRLTSMARWKGNQLVTGGSEGSLQHWSTGKQDGDLLKTDYKTGIWSLLALRGNPFHDPVLMLGGDEGVIRLWQSSFRRATSDSQPDHEVFTTGQGRIMHLLEDTRGDLISGSEDGTIKVISPPRVVRAACELYRPLWQRPTTIAEREASQLCSCQRPESWWNIWGWLCLVWGTFT